MGSAAEAMRGKDTVKAAIVARAMNRTMIAECVGREEAGGRKDGEDEALGVEEALASVVSGTGVNDGREAIAIAKADEQG